MNFLRRFFRIFLLTALVAALVFALVPAALPAIATIALGSFSIAAVAGAGFVAQLALATVASAAAAAFVLTPASFAVQGLARFISGRGHAAHSKGSGSRSPVEAVGDSTDHDLAPSPVAPSLAYRFPIFSHFLGFGNHSQSDEDAREALKANPLTPK